MFAVDDDPPPPQADRTGVTKRLNRKSNLRDVLRVFLLIVCMPINHYYSLEFYITDNFTQSVKQPVTRFDLGLCSVVDLGLVRTLKRQTTIKISPTQTLALIGTPKPLMSITFRI